MELYPGEFFQRADAPRVIVNPEKFRRLAQIARWDPRTIDLYLAPPIPRGFVKVGQLLVGVINQAKPVSDGK